jgi:hypothetical protein
MEQFGFFDAVEEHLPDEFTIIYEIARVLEDQSHAISRALAPVLELEQASNSDSPELITIPIVTDAKEYEADLIRSVTEVRSIYPAQHLLPEMVFLRRLAERSLWMPRPRTPKNFRYQTESNRFSPDDRKQKVYILFDTSSSMQQHYRIHLAKAIVYLFLTQNQRELGTVFFRTFDLTVGERYVARDIPSYDKLISDVMHLSAQGNGTVLQKALVTAIEDISHESQVSSAHILVVTDGVAHIGLDLLRPMMGNQITVNTVKIGDARMYVDSKMIEDQLLTSSSEDAVRIRELIAQRRDLERQVASASGQHRTVALKSQLQLVQRHIDTLMQKTSAWAAENYGSEIKELSSVYVNVDDIRPDEMFSLPEDKVRELEELADALLAALRDERQVEDIKRAAILYDHLMLLMKYNKIDASRFETSANELGEMLDAILNRPVGTAEDLSINELERVQLRNMLDISSFQQKLSLGTLLRVLYLKAKRWWLARRQFRAFRALTGRTLRRRSGR